MKKIKKKIIIVGIIFVLLLALFLLLWNVRKSKNVLLGSWISQGGTIYEFQRNHKGKMKVSLSEYDFTYTVQKNQLKIDYKDEKANDADYEFKIKKNVLVLKGKKGTFTFTKR